MMLRRGRKSKIAQFVVTLSFIPTLAASLRARSAESWGMQRQTKITLGEIALMIIIAAEVVIFIGYTKPGHSILSRLGLTAPSANSMPTLTRPKP